VPGAEEFKREGPYPVGPAGRREGCGECVLELGDGGRVVLQVQEQGALGGVWEARGG
jgi:hypothetical protein